MASFKITFAIISVAVLMCTLAIGDQPLIRVHQLVEHQLNKSLHSLVYRYLASPCPVHVNPPIKLALDHHESEHGIERNHSVDTRDHLFYLRVAQTLKLNSTEMLGEFIGSEEFNFTSQAMDGIELLQEIIEKISFLDSLVTDIVRTHLISECHALDFQQPENITVPEYNQENPLAAYLGDLYRVLTNQTAHLYFLYDLKSNDASLEDRSAACSGGRGLALNLTSQYVDDLAHARRVATDIYVVSDHFRKLMCQFRKVFSVFNFRDSIDTHGIVADVMTHRFRLSSSCARIQETDCQIMRNSLRIFAAITDFLRQHSHRLFFDIPVKNP